MPGGGCCKRDNQRQRERKWVPDKERDGDRKERLGWEAVISSEHSPISGATKRSEAQVLAFPLSLHVPLLPGSAVYFKPFLQHAVSNKPEIPANTSYP